MVFIGYSRSIKWLHCPLFKFNQFHCMHSTSTANIELVEAQKMQSE
jgi:hypothetical protein